MAPFNLVGMVARNGQVPLMSGFVAEHRVLSRYPVSHFCRLIFPVWFRIGELNTVVTRSLLSRIVRADRYIFRKFPSTFMSCWELEINHDGVFAPLIGKCELLGVLPLWKSVVKLSPAHH